MNLSSQDLFFIIFLLRKQIQASSLQATDTLFTRAEHKFFFRNSIFTPTSQKERISQ